MLEFLSNRASLELSAHPPDNPRMDIFGHIHNGVVVLDEANTLPEGTRVSVSPAQPIPPMSPPPKTEIVHEPGKLPYVRGGIPGTWNLTNETIAQILDDEDCEMTKGMWNVPS